MRPHHPSRHHKGGPKRTLDERAVMRERERALALPRSKERTAALYRVKRQLERIACRSPWK